MIFVSATKPISIMQYVKGKTSDNVSNSDPSMIRVTPIEQYVKETTFPVYAFPRRSTNINTIHLEITAECKYFMNISIFKDHQQLSVSRKGHRLKDPTVLSSPSSYTVGTLPYTGLWWCNRGDITWSLWG